MVDNGVKKDFYSKMKLKDVNQEYLNELYKIADADTAEETVASIPPMKKTRWNARVMSRVAALLVIGVVASTGIALLMLEQDANAAKEAEKQQIVAESENDQVVVGRDAASEDENAEPVKNCFGSESDIPSAKKLVPELVIPGYIPEGYAFQELSIEEFQNDGTYVKYLYVNEDNSELLIKQFIFLEDSAPAKTAQEYSHIITVDGVDLYLSDAEIDENLFLTFSKESSRISVSGQFSEEEMLEVAKGMM